MEINSDKTNMLLLLPALHKQSFLQDRGHGRTRPKKKELRCGRQYVPQLLTLRPSQHGLLEPWLQHDFSAACA